MTDIPDLLPCPFCGGEATFSPDHTTEKCDSVWCTKCDCHISDFNLNAQSDCIAAWNARPALSDEAALIEIVHDIILNISGGTPIEDITDTIINALRPYLKGEDNAENFAVLLKHTWLTKGLDAMNEMLNEKCKPLKAKETK